MRCGADTKDGTAIPLEVTVAEVDDDMAPLLVCIVRDITQRKQADESRTQQAALLDLAHDAILMRSFETGAVLYWNRGAAALYGWSSDEALGKRLMPCCVPRFRSPERRSSADCSTSGAGTASWATAVVTGRA